MNLSPNVAACVAALEGAYGARFQYHPAHAAIWQRLLGSYSTDQLMDAVERVIRHHTHGAPGAAEIVQAVEGRWETKKVSRTDAHLVPIPGQWVELLCLVEYGSGRVVRAFDERLAMVEHPSGRLLKEPGDVPPALLPPSSMLDERQQIEMRGADGPLRLGDAIDGGAA